jgi:hypothetical protein
VRNVFRPAAVVEAWLELMRPAQAQAVRAVMQAVAAAHPGLQVAVKWGSLVVQQGEQTLLTVTPFRRFVHLQLTHGAALVRQFPMLVGQGPGARLYRLRISDPVDEPLITAMTSALLARLPSLR